MSIDSDFPPFKKKIDELTNSKVHVTFCGNQIVELNGQFKSLSNYVAGVLSDLNNVLEANNDFDANQTQVLSNVVVELNRLYSKLDTAIKSKNCFTRFLASFKSRTELKSYENRLKELAPKTNSDANSTSFNYKTTSKDSALLPASSSACSPPSKDQENKDFLINEVGLTEEEAESALRDFAAAKPSLPPISAVPASLADLTDDYLSEQFGRLNWNRAQEKCHEIKNRFLNSSEQEVEKFKERAFLIWRNSQSAIELRAYHAESFAELSDEYLTNEFRGLSWEAFNAKIIEINRRFPNASDQEFKVFGKRAFNIWSNSLGASSLSVLGRMLEEGDEIPVQTLETASLGAGVLVQRDAERRDAFNAFRTRIDVYQRTDKVCVQN